METETSELFSSKRTKLLIFLSFNSVHLVEEKSPEKTCRE